MLWKITRTLALPFDYYVQEASDVFGQEFFPGASDTPNQWSVPLYNHPVLTQVIPIRVSLDRSDELNSS